MKRRRVLTSAPLPLWSLRRRVAKAEAAFDTRSRYLAQTASDRMATALAAAGDAEAAREAAAQELAEADEVEIGKLTERLARATVDLSLATREGVRG